MKTKILLSEIAQKSLIIILVSMIFSCKKNDLTEDLSPLTKEESSVVSKANSLRTSEYNLEVVLRGSGNRNGHIHFRQDADATKIITLDTKVNNLESDHAYLLQRAVDPINVVDGNCTSNSWLTLGLGLMPHEIITNDKGNGEDILWRDITAIPTAAEFDIHFRVVDAITAEVVLMSDCYQYTVR